MKKKLFENIDGNQFKLVNENISTNDLQNFIDKMNKETGRNYYLGGAYGNYELWDRSATGEHRLEVGSRNDIYQYLIKNRFKKSISERESDDDINWEEVEIPDNETDAKKLLDVAVEYYGSGKDVDKNGNIIYHPVYQSGDIINTVETIEDKFPALKGYFDSKYHGQEPDREDNNFNIPDN